MILFNDPEMTLYGWQNIKIQELAVLFKQRGPYLPRDSLIS